MTPDCCIHSLLFTFQSIHTAKEWTNVFERFSHVTVQHKVRYDVHGAVQASKPRASMCPTLLGITSHMTLHWSPGAAAVTASHQPLQTETLEGPEEGIVLGRGRFPGRCGLTRVEKTVNLITAIPSCKRASDFMAAYPGQTVVAPEMGLSDHLLCVFLGQHSLLPFPLTRGTWSSRARDFINGL